MQRSLITIKPSALTAAEIKQNSDMIAELFKKNISFKELLTKEFDRDGDKRPELAEVLAEVNEPNFDPVKIKLSSLDYQTILVDELKKHHILLNDEIIQFNNDLAYAQRIDLRRYFQAVLCKRAVEIDANLLLNNAFLHEDLQTYLDKIHTRKIQSYRQSIQDFFVMLNLRQHLLIAKAPGNGDCFYHSTMLNLIHDALNNQINENSTTAKCLKDNLLPAINQQLQSLGVKPLDFSNLTIKDSMIKLLNAVPYQSAHTGNSVNNSEEIKAINNCNLYHLLTDVCAPALRQLIQADSKNLHTQDAVKKVLALEFHSLIKIHFGKQLGFDDFTIEQAKNYFSAGEFCHAIDKRKNVDTRKDKTLQSWIECFKSFLSNYSTTSLNMTEETLNEIFNKWWKKHHAKALNGYFQHHANTHIMGGFPQQVALSHQLHCDFINVNTGTGALDRLTPKLDAAHPIHLHNTGLHYDAIVGNVNLDAPTAVTQTLQNTTAKINQQKCFPYQWDRQVESHSSPKKTETVDESIQTTLTAIAEAEIKTPNKFTQLNEHSLEILEAAKNHFAAARAGSSLSLPHRFFYSKSKQEDDDLQLAIKMQVEEIQRFLKTS